MVTVEVKELAALTTVVPYQAIGALPRMPQTGADGARKDIKVVRTTAR